MRVILCVFLCACVSMSAFYGCSAAFTSCEDFKIAARCSKSSAGGGVGSYSGERGFIFIPRRDSLPETCEKNQYLRFFRAQWAHHDRIRQMQMTPGQKGHHFPIRNPAFYPLMAPAILAGIKCG